MTQGCHPKYINYAYKSIEKNYNQNQTGKKKKWNSQREQWKYLTSM